MNELELFCQKKLAALAVAGRLRQFHPLEVQDGLQGQIFLPDSDMSLLNLSSNDYLGFAADKKLLTEFYQQYDNVFFTGKMAFGSTSSRLLAGDRELAHTLEDELAISYGAEAALLFNSGYHCNIGILPALYRKRDLILSDKLNHASIVDGCRLSLATTKRYSHLDYDHLRWLLEKNRSSVQRAVIVSESVFSMDGDVAELETLVQLKNEFNAELYLDEAHGFGLYGKRGLGKAEEAGLLEEVDYLVGVFGKAMASQGAFVICSDIIRRYLVNTARSLIFTTAMPPIITAWNLFVFRYMQRCVSQREHLTALAQQLRDGLRQHGLQTGGITNIVPVIIGDDALTSVLATRMQQHGFFILPIRPPTVPVNTSRFRLSLSAAMQWQDLFELPAIIAQELSLLREE